MPDKMLTNYTYFGARYYDSDLSSWLSVDPLADQRSWVSPYSYCQNSPVMRVDPTGALDNPIYNFLGKFLGTDDKGLQGEPILMDESKFTQGMSHDEATNNGTLYSNLNDGAKGLFKSGGGQEHWLGLRSRPDWDGFVTDKEGIAWAKDHPGALENPSPDNMLYINTGKLDFGNISVADFGKEGAVTAINLLNFGNSANSITNGTLYSTIYALGRVDMVLHSRSYGVVSIVNDFNQSANRATDYDWNTGGGTIRSGLIGQERYRKGLNDSHGFRVYYYGLGFVKSRP